jgi:beta-N-acetylhexosaminidase
VPTRRPLLVVLAVLALALAACSSSSGKRTSSTTTTPVTAAGGTTTTSSPSNCVDVAAQPLAWRARQLVTLPVLNFQVRGLSSLIQQGVGGLLFLGPNPPPNDLAAQLRSAANTNNPALAPLVTADVEGGGIQRLPGLVQNFPWPRDLAASQSPAQVQQLATNVGNQMKAAGVNVDLAPVVDLDDRPGPSQSNPDGQRSFSIDPNTASDYGIAFMKGLQQAGVLPVLKHFPGLGGSTENTDYGPAATKPLADLKAAGLKPFIAAIAAGAPAIMVSNAYTPGLSTKPASVSADTIQGLLRDQLGFDGLVVTDSLSAGALTAAGYDVPKATVAAIGAGADLVLFGSTLTPAATAQLSPANVGTSLNAIVTALTTAVQNGSLPESRVDDAVTHVLQAKGVTLCGG